MTKDFWIELKKQARENIELVLVTAVPKHLHDQARKKMSAYINQLKQTKKFRTKLHDGKRWEEVKKKAAEGSLFPLRQCGDSDTLMLMDLPLYEINNLKQDWTPDWQGADKFWKQEDGMDLWRCSSAVLALARND